MLLLVTTGEGAGSADGSFAVVVCLLTVPTREHDLAGGGGGCGGATVGKLGCC